MNEVRKFSISEIKDVDIQSSRNGAHLALFVNDEESRAYIKIRISSKHLLSLFQNHSHEFIAKKKISYLRKTLVTLETYGILEYPNIGILKDGFPEGALKKMAGLLSMQRPATMAMQG